MRYKATIILDAAAVTKSFLSMEEAENWIDSENNNEQYTSYIQTVDQSGNVLDWFYYTL
jgi:hypothetical protein